MGRGSVIRVDASTGAHQSAPNLNGYCRGGGAKVESISSLPPTLCTFHGILASRMPYNQGTNLVRVMLDIPAVRTGLVLENRRQLHGTCLASPVGLSGVSSQQRSPGLYAASKSIISKLTPRLFLYTSMVA